MLFTIAISLDALAIGLVMANALYNGLYLDSKTESTGLVVLIGFGYGLLIGLAYYLKSTGKPVLALLLAGLPALPILLMGFYLFMLLLFHVFSKVDWK